MSVLEKAISIFAPHDCLVCGDESKLLCDWCRPDALTPVPPRCYRCQAQSEDFATCKKCRPRTRLAHVWVATDYQDVSKQLLHRFKFERARAGADVIADWIIQTLPYLPPETIISHVPTATSRRRQRGYDQAELIARRVAKHTGTRFVPLLARLGQSRQVGASRKQRQAQLENAFRPRNPSVAANASVLLIDDIVTTGATLEAAAQALKAGGVRKISAAVFAQRLR